MKPNTVHFSNLEVGSGSNAKPRKAKTKKKGKAFQVSSNASFKKEGNKQKCHFCRKMGHFQNDCLKKKVWFEKKGMTHTFVTFESNFIDVPNNTWWIDSGSTTHISNNLQGFLTIQITSQS